MPLPATLITSMLSTGVCAAPVGADMPWLWLKTPPMGDREEANWGIDVRAAVHIARVVATIELKRILIGELNAASTNFTALFTRIPLPASARAFSIRGAQGNAVRYLTCQFDIRDLKRAEPLLAAEVKLLGMVARGRFMLRRTTTKVLPDTIVQLLRL